MEQPIGSTVSYRLLGPPPWIERDPRTGVVDLLEQRLEDGTQQVHAIRIDQFAVIDAGMLGWVRQGSVRGARIDGDRLVLTLENGTWAYQLGEFDDRYDAFMLRLVDGRPLSPPDQVT
ncbi:hypothetical protein [Nocardia aurea]|uniref:hypothetical protein n=1 Tax=Nocardia aurea TaxID=2144174 RepID=UPI0033B68D98